MDSYTIPNTCCVDTAVFWKLKYMKSFSSFLLIFFFFFKLYQSPSLLHYTATQAAVAV